MVDKLVALVLALVVAACWGPSEPSVLRGVTLTPTASAYVAGQTVSAILANGSLVEISYGGGCDIGLERSAGGEWVAYGPQTRLCTASLLTLLPDAEATVAFRLEPTVESGTYRLRMGVAPVRRGSAQDVRSPSFSVTAPE